MNFSLGLKYENKSEAIFSIWVAKLKEYKFVVNSSGHIYCHLEKTYLLKEIWNQKVERSREMMRESWWSCMILKNSCVWNHSPHGILLLCKPMRFLKLIEFAIDTLKWEWYLELYSKHVLIPSSILTLLAHYI